MELLSLNDEMAYPVAGFEIGEPIEYNRAPKTDIALGRGFDPVDLADVKRPGIVFQPTRLDHGSPLAKFDYLYVADHRSFLEEIKLDKNVSISYLGNKAETAIKHGFSNSFSSTSINVIIKIWADYGRWGLNAEAALSPEADKLLKSDPREFARVYGTRYVATESRMSAIYVLITINSVSTSVKSKLETTLGGGGGIGSLKGTARMTFIEEVKRSVDTDRISIDAYTIGGKGISGFKDLVIQKIKGEKEPLESIAKAVSETAGTLEESNAIPYLYLVGDMRNFELQYQPEIVWSSTRSSALNQLSELYDKADQELSILKEIRNKNHVLYHLIGDPAKTDKLVAAIPTYEAYLTDLATCHYNCRKNPDPNSFTIPAFSPSALTDYKHWMKTPTVYFNGNYIKEGEQVPQSVRQDILEKIINTPPAERENLTRQLLPGSVGGIGVMMSPSGFGMSYVEIYDNLVVHRIQRGEISSGTVTERYTKNIEGISIGWSLFNAEEKILPFILENRKPNPVTIGEVVNYNYYRYIKITDKAGRNFEYIIANYDITVTYAMPPNPDQIIISVTYYPMLKFDQ